MTHGLSGRISESPSNVVHDEVLNPQFIYEMENLLSYYIQIEEAMLLEYVAMGWIEPEDGGEISKILESITSDTLIANPEENMSDIAFAIEQEVEKSLSKQVPCWHVDRSRNEFQACAQLLFGRSQWINLMKDLSALINSMHNLAKKYTDTPMPGYTHYQSAQIITPGFYISTMNQELLQAFNRWSDVYKRLNYSPLGAGGMAGVDLEWDRKRLADLLGFSHFRESALASVASREWVLQISAELSTFSVLISRFMTDLIQWGSSEYSFIDLPDQLSGISSAMPQKKNFPILERIRGKTAHLSAFHQDMVLGQRNTPFTNLVETSKEAGTHVLTMFRTARSLITLLKTVIDHLSFNEERMLEICKRDYFGGFTLSNLLTMKFNIPYRKSQVIVGKYIKIMTQRNLLPLEIDHELLYEICIEEGFELIVKDSLKDLLITAFDVQSNLYIKTSFGSVNPTKLKEMLEKQERSIQENEERLEQRDKQMIDVTTSRNKQLKNLIDSYERSGRSVAQEYGRCNREYPSS